MDWKKTAGGLQVRSLKISRMSSQGYSIEDLKTISGASVGLVYPVRVAQYSTSAEIEISHGKVNSLQASLVGADFPDPRFYLERLVADFEDGGVCCLVSWHTDPGLAILDKLLKETEPLYLEALIDRRHVSCGIPDREYVISNLWNSVFIEPLKELADFANVASIYEFLDQVRQ